jgi:hypothetical protein
MAISVHFLSITRYVSPAHFPLQCLDTMSPQGITGVTCMCSAPANHEQTGHLTAQRHGERLADGDHT